MDNIIEIKNVSKIYNSSGSFLGEKPRETHALKNINLDIKRGEILGLVGESGCGKSTLGNCILKIIDVTSGEIFYNGKNINDFDKKELFKFREKTSLIFQNPYSSLNPKMKIEEIVEEPLIIHKIGKNKEEKRKIAIKTLELVGLFESDLKKYPHEFSGGQRQRIAIARALILNPEFIVADEPVSALDVSIQAQIINLLSDLRNNLNLTFLFISHDLNVVRYLCDRIAIIYKGEIVEINQTEEIFKNPKHDYTKTLLSSIPLIKF